MKVKNEPEYAYFLWGLFAKILGGVFFSLIYFYYYQGGDTISYFYSALSMSKLAKIDPVGFFTVLFGENNFENRRFFSMETGFPWSYVYYDDRTFLLIRLITPLVILSLDSYLITTVLLASVSYVGIWKAYRTFVSYFPELRSQLAIAFLFMPSCIFWGSAILKDTLTFSATCLWIHAVDELFFKRRGIFMGYVLLVISGVLILAIKPYIFLVLFPTTMAWLLYFRVVRMRNIMIKFVFLPVVVLLLFLASVFVLQSLESSLGKFSLEESLSTIQLTQEDMKRSEQYGQNFFDIGYVDYTWSGILFKSPVVIMAGLFRPFLWESRNVVMVLGGLENFWLLSMTVFTILSAGPIFFIRAISSMPLLLMSFLFVVLFAFLIGITTPNFGALVRFKIPLIPLFVSTLFIVRHITQLARESRRKSVPFDLGSLRNGTAGMSDAIPKASRTRSFSRNDTSRRSKFGHRVS